MAETNGQTPRVYAAIAAVSAELAGAGGIAKDRINEQQHYKFRGVDDVFNALAPLLAKHGLVILSRMLSRTCEARASLKGGTLYSVTVDAEFDFVSVADGSLHTAKTYGEAMDSGDKATNKAMSAAYKYAAFQVFCIPTAGDHDADATTPPATRPAVARTPRPPRAPLTARQAPASRPEDEAPPTPAPASTPAASAKRERMISDGQRIEMYGIGKAAGWTKKEIKEAMKKTIGVDSSTDLPVRRYREFCELLKLGTEPREPGIEG